MDLFSLELTQCSDLYHTAFQVGFKYVLKLLIHHKKNN